MQYAPYGIVPPFDGVCNLCAVGGGFEDTLGIPLAAVQQALAADSPHDLISMSGDRVSRGTPGLVVPEMSWDL